MPAKTSRGRTNTNSKFNFRKRSFWKRKSTIVSLAVVIVGAGIILKSFAATNAPTGVVDIDISGGYMGTKYVAALQGLGVPNVARVGCNTTACLASPWTNLGGALKNINVEANTDGGAIVGGTGTDNQYWFRTTSCAATCAWSPWYAAGGNTSSLQTVLENVSHGNCDSLLAIGTDHYLYVNSLCDNTSTTTGWQKVSGGIIFTKLYRINDGSDVIGIDSSSQAWDLAVDPNHPYSISFNKLYSGVIPMNSDRPIAIDNLERGLVVGTDGWTYVLNSVAGTNTRNHAYSNAALVSDVFKAYGPVTWPGSSSLYNEQSHQYIVRAGNGTTYEISPDADYNASGLSNTSTITGAVTNLGGSCSKERVSDGVIVCIGSDQNVYYRSFNVAPNNGTANLGTSSVGWTAL
jgi:hypothetical protein